MTNAKSQILFQKTFTANDYIQDNLVAMYDGQYNSVNAMGKLTYDANENRILEIMSKTYENYSSTFRCDKEGHFYEVIKSVAASRNVLMGQKLKQCVQDGYARLEGVIFTNARQYYIYGNNIYFANGGFGYNFYIGSGGSNCYSSDWIKPENTIDKGLDRVSFSLEICKDLVTYSIMGQSSVGTVSLQDGSDLAWIKSDGMTDQPHQTSIFSMRLYSAPLSDEQIEFNKHIDKCRF